MLNPLSRFYRHLLYLLCYSVKVSIGDWLKCDRVAWMCRFQNTETMYAVEVGKQELVYRRGRDEDVLTRVDSS
jgi:hypothetical protein